MLHLHFGYLERTDDGYLLTEEHSLMLEAIRDRDADRADALAPAHTRLFQSNFLSFAGRLLRSHEHRSECLEGDQEVNEANVLVVDRKAVDAMVTAL